MDQDSDSRRIVVAALGAALVAFAIFWVRGVAYLYGRHPHEDAYILFRYVDNLVTGQGIAFNPGGPPTEGATDFLWMIALSLWVRLGVDVALAAVWLNALGCGLMASVCSSTAASSRRCSGSGCRGPRGHLRCCRTSRW